MNIDNNGTNERIWSDRTNRSNDSKKPNMDRSQHPQNNSQSAEDNDMNGSSKGKTNETGPRTEQLSPMGGGQQANPRGRVQDQGNEEPGSRSPQNRQSGDMQNLDKS